MTSRTWIAVSLCCLIWFGYLQWFAPKPAAHPSTGTVTSSNTTGHEETTSSSAKPVGNPLIDTKFSVANSEVLQNDDVKISFTSTGAKPYKAELFKYRQSIDKDAPPIELFGTDIHQTLLGTFFSSADLKGFENASYKLEEKTPRSLKYVYGNSQFSLEKTYQLKDNYSLEIGLVLHVLSGEVRDLGYLTIPLTAKGLVSDHNRPLHSWEFVAYQNDSVTRKTPEHLPTEDTVQQGNTSWIAFGNRYFSTVLANLSTINPDVVFSKSGEVGSVSLRYPLVRKSDQKEISFSIQGYLGPKSAAELRVIPNGQRLVDYGMFRILAYPMLDLLRFFNRFVHNYGLSIILLTFIVRILFFPLGVKSARSMKAMQKLQPQIQALKEKYKDDTARFNQEQMALFKVHKVNPLGGCLPILVQIPVFLALYSVLANSIELFHAPFFGWLRDLSAKDPFYVFPILMGGAMLVQQTMTPMVGMDPAQRKMMYVMPVVMTFFMVNLPSGLTVYFFLSTLLGILQQYFTNRDKSSNLVPVPVAGAKV